MVGRSVGWLVGWGAWVLGSYGQLAFWNSPLTTPKKLQRQDSIACVRLFVAMVLTLFAGWDDDYDMIVLHVHGISWLHGGMHTCMILLKVHIH